MFCPKCGFKSFFNFTIKSYKCTNCSFHIFINAAAAVAGIIRNRNNEVLFTVRKFEPKSEMLDLPGGFVEYNESAEVALIREIKEELGINVTSLAYYKSFPNTYKYDGLIYRTLDLYYFCDTDNIEDIKVNDDVNGYIFISVGSVNITQVGFESTKQIILDLKQYSQDYIKRP